MREKGARHNETDEEAPVRLGATRLTCGVARASYKSRRERELRQMVEPQLDSVMQEIGLAASPALNHGSKVNAILQLEFSADTLMRAQAFAANKVVARRQRQPAARRQQLAARRRSSQLCGSWLFGHGLP